MVLEEEEITDESLLAAVRRLYADRHTYEQSMAESRQMDSIHHILSLIEECAQS